MSFSALIIGYGRILYCLSIYTATLINSTAVDWVPHSKLGTNLAVCQIEIAAKNIILANGALCESYIGAAGRAAFDNFSEYLDPFGTGHLIPKMDRLRISRQQLLPEIINVDLGITGEAAF